MTTLAQQSLLDTLPEALQRAQRAIALPEVIASMKLLALHNLAICMPHAHSTERDFDVLPVGMVQVERNQVVNFRTEQELKSTATIPVAWRWEIDGQGVSRIAGCNCCVPAPATGQHNV